MRRVVVVLTVALVMSAMATASAMPSLAVLPVDLPLAGDLLDLVGGLLRALPV